MATKKTKTAPKRARNAEAATTSPQFPYTKTPAALRRFLQLVPEKPSPEKINPTLLRSWGFGDTNSHTITRVLKSLGLVDSSNTPTEKYKRFMSTTGGAAVLADAIRGTYEPLFKAEHLPHTKDDAILKNLFNIHSGGGDEAMRLQIQTFKALADHADWTQPSTTTGTDATQQNRTSTAVATATSSQGAPTIHIDLHIHLPEGKSRRDYEYMFEDIARYIYGRTDQDNTNER